jgi:hypothetical protein
MPGLGHFPMSEDPDQFARFLLPILDEIATTPDSRHQPEGT